MLKIQEATQSAKRSFAIFFLAILAALTGPCASYSATEEDRVAKLIEGAKQEGAPHPNAAKLYIDFCLGKEGQMVLVECDRFPSRADMDVEKFRALKALKVYPSDFSLADDFNAYTKQFAEALPVRRGK